MTTYAITSQTATLRNLGTARAGADIYNINGGKLTIDQDTRYGLNGGTAFSLGSMTISATLGGVIEVNATKVRLVPYTGGSGTITAGSTITCGGATGTVIGLYSAINVAPVLTGVAAGWIKITEWNGVAFPTSGAFTQAGFTFTINGADKAGWIEVVGEDAAVCTVPRLGGFQVRGDWFDVGTTSGSNATTYQVPTNGSITYLAGVQVETDVGSGLYEWYPCAGSLVAASSTATDAVRGKVCWISTAGVLRFGSDGTNAVGYVPPAGLKVRIPNILFVNCTAAAKTANVLPSATLGTRYDFATTGAGVIDIEKANLAWYPSFAQPFSVRLVDVAIHEQLSVSEIASPIAWERVCVGQTTAQPQIALLMALCFAGGTVTDCVWTSATLAAGGRYVISLTDVSGITFTRDKSNSRVARANATTGNSVLTRVNNCTWNNPVFGIGRQAIVTCSSLKFNNTTYFDVPTGATGTGNAMYVFDPSVNSQDITIDGLSFGGLTNVHPYSGILTVSAAGCKNIKLRNIGTRAAPLSLGSANQSAYVFLLAAGAAADNIRIQRVYATGTRTGYYSMDNSSRNILIESSQGDYADAPVTPGLNVVHKGVGCTPAMAAQTSCYGTHWFDVFTSATVGRIGILMNEATATTADQVSLANGAAFTSAGGLFMPVIGHSATFTLPYSALGHTAFANSALVMAGGTVGNYTFAWQADTGAGFGAWSAELTAAALGTALSGLGAIDPAVGVRLKLRITTSVTNTTAITSVYVITDTTGAAQDNQYPLDTNTVTFTGLPTGCDVVVLQAGTSTILAQRDEGASSSYGFTYAGAQSVDVGFLKSGYVPLYIRNLSLGTLDSSIPVAMTIDRNYL